MLVMIKVKSDSLELVKIWPVSSLWISNQQQFTARQQHIKADQSNEKSLRNEAQTGRSTMLGVDPVPFDAAGVARRAELGV